MAIDCKHGIHSYTVIICNCTCDAVVLERCKCTIFNNTDPKFSMWQFPLLFAPDIEIQRLVVYLYIIKQEVSHVSLNLYHWKQEIPLNTKVIVCRYVYVHHLCQQYVSYRGFSGVKCVSLFTIDLRECITILFVVLHSVLPTVYYCTASLSLRMHETMFTTY